MGKTNYKRPILSASIGHKATSGAIWATIDKVAFMGIQFSINLILARILLPKDFGIVGMITIFIVISQTLTDAGFGSALIQKKNPTQTDFSTIFFWNLGLSVIIYLILFISAPIISHFFKLDLLCDVLRVLALGLIINGITAVQRIRLQKKLAFQTIAIVNLTSYTIGGVTAIIMAENGYGVWSLVYMQLVYGLCNIMLLWVTTKWHPSATFSVSSFRSMFGFGGYIMAANILQTVCNNIQGVIIGKRFSATQLGFYSQAYKLDQVTSVSIPQVILQVAYPIYSSLQDDLDRLNKIILMNIRVTAFVVFPILATLILIAEPLILFLYGQKWIPAVPYFRIFCVGGFFVCLQNLSFYAVAAVGKSRDLFYWSFYKWGFLLISLLIGMEFGMYGILWAMVLGNINIYFTNAMLAQRHIGLKIINQLRSTLPIFFTVAISIVIGFILNYISNMPFLSAPISIITYLFLSYVFDLKAMVEVKDIIKTVFSKSKFLKE